MAKKRQRRVPQVPRSSDAGRTVQPKDEQREIVAGLPGTAGVPRVVRPAATAPRADFAAEYSYVRKDLTRILVLAVLLFGGMGILRIAGF